MELVKNLKEGAKKGVVPRECCGGEPSICVPFSDEIGDGKEAYKVTCIKCNTTTAYYETREEAVQAWNNKIQVVVFKAVGIKDNRKLCLWLSRLWKGKMVFKRSSRISNSMGKKVYS